MRPARTLLLLAAPAWSGLASAAEQAARRFAEPSVAQAAPAPVSSLAQVTFSLALVLAAVFAAAWLLKRVRGVTQRGQAGLIEVVAERAVGPRERVVLLDVGGLRVLVGVAPGSVRCLHAGEGPAGTAARPEPRP